MADVHYTTFEPCSAFERMGKSGSEIEVLMSRMDQSTQLDIDKFVDMIGARKSHIDGEHK